MPRKVDPEEDAPEELLHEVLWPTARNVSARPARTRLALQTPRVNALRPSPADSAARSGPRRPKS